MEAAQKLVCSICEEEEGCDDGGAVIVSVPCCHQPVCMGCMEMWVAKEQKSRPNPRCPWCRAAIVCCAGAGVPLSTAKTAKLDNGEVTAPFFVFVQELFDTVSAKLEEQIKLLQKERRRDRQRRRSSIADVRCPCSYCRGRNGGRFNKASEGGCCSQRI